MKKSLSKIQLVIPMSGLGTRYIKAGYGDPKPLIPLNDKTMIERVLDCFPQDWPVLFIVSKEHQKFGMAQTLRALRPDSKIVEIESHILGPGHALQQAITHLTLMSPVLVSYCDYGMIWSAKQFEEFVDSSLCDSCVVSYRGFHAHYNSPTMYAYSRLVGCRVEEVKEKGSFTSQRENEFASCGAYYFKSAQLLFDSLLFQREKNLSLNGEFYTSLTVQALIEMKQNADVRVFEIPYFFQWGTPDDLESFCFWERSFKNFNSYAGKRDALVDQILIPMAGFGTRFQSVTEVPKPWISVAGQPMYEAAIETLPQSKNVTVVVKKEHAQKYSIPHNFHVVTVDETPAGQALSTEIGLKLLSDHGDVLVSACDHGITFDVDLWREFRQSPNCDAAIFGVRGFFGAKQNPQSYAFIEVEHDDSKIPSVKNVSVKKAISSQPQNDWVLVGSFWFRSKKVLARGIELLKHADLKVNNELYLDSIFMLLSANGHSVRMFPLSGYLCWGEPNRLAEALYYREAFLSEKINVRQKFPGI